MNKRESPRLVVQGAPEIKREEIEELELVGTGQYGDVFKGRCRGYEVAIKKLRTRKTDEHLVNFKREVEIMSRIRFPNVCLLLGACTDPDYFCIVQEYLPGGDLATLLEKGRLPPSFYGRMRLASHVARGMLWIHSNGVLHRDLKLENLLLNNYNEVKVADFGLADTMGTLKLIWDEKGRKGSPLYMAPEVLLKKGLNNKVDVYAFAVILWELLSEKRAFQHHLLHNNMDAFTHAICREGERPPIPPDETIVEEGWKNTDLVNLITKCWSEKARDRPDFQEIYSGLNIIITDGFIKDPWGRSFWKTNFPDQDSVAWDEFKKILLCKKKIFRDDGTSLCRGLALNKKDPETEKIARCVRILLAQISGVTKSLFSHVTCENFGKLLQWFGPGIEYSKGSHKTFLERVKYICQEQWFHGCVENPDTLLQGDSNLFLVRLSPSNPGCFTIQTSKVRSRIVYTPNKGYQPEMGDKEIFQDFVKWINVNMKEYIPLLNSEFSEVFGTGKGTTPNAYLPPSSLSISNIVPPPSSSVPNINFCLPPSSLSLPIINSYGFKKEFSEKKKF